jgi:hypothetical protein
LFCDDDDPIIVKFSTTELKLRMTLVLLLGEEDSILRHSKEDDAADSGLTRRAET